ncbi:hypothetical protein F4677DRAFT_448762 [Hypoxylon crocopeplum]|nr:hypothetical protein F4677DRAFT_448762 [Hypoxylon crocopeplum]
MRFSTHGSTAVAMAASFANATAPLPAPVSERHLLDLDLPKGLSKPISANVDLGVDLSGTTLLAGVVANVAVPPIAAVGADVAVAVICDTCYTKGNVNATISMDKVVPALSLTLSDIEAKLDLDIKIGAAATIAVNLFAPVAPISLPLPGLKVDALVYLDLVLGVETAIDLSAGIDVKLVDEAKIETDIFAGKILDAAFSGLSVQVLPIEVRIGCTKLLADLRLRVELGVAAEIDLDDIIPILDLPDIGAGLEVAVFANLLEYVGFFCATPTCPLSKESYGLNIGAAVELDVAVEDLLSIHLAPTLSTALLSFPTTTLCEHPSYTVSVPTLSATTSSASATGSASTVSSGSASVTSSASASGSASATGSASGSGSASATASGSGSASATGSGSGSYPTGSASATGTSATAPLTTSTPAGGVITSTITNTQTFTVTQCAATVPNCPAGYETTATVVHTTVYTTVCPATQTEAITAPPKPTHTKPATPVTVTKKVVTLVPCSEVSTFTPPANVPTAPYPTGSKPAPSTTAASYPAGSASASYPAGSASASYPAGSASASYPVGGASYPVGGSSSAPAYPTVVPPYPTAPAGSNGTSTYSPVETLSTYKPSASASYSTPSYPTGPAETPIPTAGAAKVGSGVAGALAIVGALVALM